MASISFAATGIDINEEAARQCMKMLQGHGYQAVVFCCSCAELPFADEHFDMVVSRETFTVLPDGAFETAFSEVRRVLRQARQFLFAPIATAISVNDSLSAGFVLLITGGSLVVGDRGVRFMSVNETRSLYRNGWMLKSVYLKELTEMIEPMRVVDAWWNVVAEKV